MKALRQTAVLLGILGAVALRSLAADRPNLILIVADDLGYGDVGCYGGRLAPTPAIDSLARDGVRCTDGYVTAPVCAPSRCGIMTGAYNERFGIQWNEDRSKYNVGPHKVLPQALKAAGYRTGHIGKWNVGADIAGCFDETHDVIDWEADYFPDKAGHFFGVDSLTEHASSKVQGIWGPQRPGEEYLTDRLGRHACEFIEKHRAQPFFLYLAFNAVHAPWQAKASERAKYAHLPTEPLRLYAPMIAALDENIGRVLAKLKDTGLTDNTLVVFVSDNGPAIKKAGIPYAGWPKDWPEEQLFGSAGPLRGHKADFFEGGIREPFLLRWPAQLMAGATYRQPVSTMDLYPTFCAAAGASVPAGTRLDGVNLLPRLRGEQPGAPHAILFWKDGAQGAVRRGDWKLVISARPPQRQLFNLAADVGEQHDLAGAQPQLAAELNQAWLDWSAPLPPRANPQAAKRGKGKQAAAGALTTPERAALFGQKDKNHDGKLSADEFLANQPDRAAAQARFDKWDTDHDGFLSREEFINLGGKSK